MKRLKLKYNYGVIVLSNGNIRFYKEFMNNLTEGVKPALGCTEPVAVGLAASAAYKDLKGKVESIEIRVSPNIYKNGMGVGIPGTTEIGLIFAAALGVTCGDCKLGLEVYKNVNQKAVEDANRLIEEDRVEVNLEEDEGRFYIEALVKTSGGSGKCIIRDSHTNIVYIEKNGEIELEKKKPSREDELDDEKCLNLENVEIVDIRNFIENVEYRQIEFLIEGARMNKKAAEVGLREKPGPAIGAALKSLIDQGFIEKNMVNDAKIMASAASDARMAGLNIPVMSSGGSGNQGITAIIPVMVACEYLECSDEKLARSLAYSHIMTAYIKTFTGNLSPVCGCAIAAGIGASTGITWAMGGTDTQIGYAVKNMVGTLTGMVCDGAKGGCAFKIATAASEATLQAKLALANVVINEFDGIVDPSTEQTIKNLGDFSNGGMSSADKEIINIMLNK